MSQKELIFAEKAERDVKIKKKIETVVKQIEESSIPRYKREQMKFNEKFKKAQEEKARIAALMSPKPEKSSTLSPQAIKERKNSQDLTKVKNDLLLEKEQLLIDENG